MGRVNIVFSWEHKCQRCCVAYKERSGDIKIQIGFTVDEIFTDSYMFPDSPILECSDSLECTQRGYPDWARSLTHGGNSGNSNDEMVNEEQNTARKRLGVG